MKLIRSLSLLLALLVCALPLSGLAEGERAQITLTVSGSRNTLCESWAETIMVKDIEEMFGIVLDCREVPQGDWAVQRGLMFASGDLPDLFFSAGLSLLDAADYGGQGLLIPLNDLIEAQGPHTQAVFAKNPAAKSLMTSPDGGIYTLIGGSAIPANMANRNWINEVWIENVGLSYPRTIDELRDVLTAFLTEDANQNGDATDEIPASGRVLDEIILNALGFPVRSSAGTTLFLKDGAPSMLALDERFKAYLQYMNEFYAAGLLDSATFVQTSDELNAKIAEGRVGAYTSAAPWLYESEATAWDYRYFGGLTSEHNDAQIVGASNGLEAYGSTAITNVNAHPERSFELLDWFYSDEGSTHGFIGAQGVGWRWVDEAQGAWARVTPEGWTDTDEAYRVGKLVIIGMNIYRDANWKLFNPTGNNIWLYDQYTDYAVPYFTDIFPTVVLTEEERDAVATIQTDLNGYVSDAVVRFILGEDDIEAGWDNFQATMMNMGAETYLSIYADAYARYLG